MISRLPTCFSTVLLLVLLNTPAWIQAGTVTGSVRLIGSTDSAVKKHSDYSGVVVSLQPLGQEVPSRISRHERMVQKGKRFTPHVLAVETGTTIDFPNFDPIFHNAFSNFSGQLFDIGLYPPGTSRAIRFDRPGIVRVFCNIHPTMSALIVVVPSPYFATTQTDGSFSIPSVVPGKYELHVVHERALPKTLESLSRVITVTAEPVQVPLFDISEAGYLPMPHRNKYGQAYPSTADEQSTYSLPIQ
jgi:plastocyanin